jgi:hypothetical protein
MGISRGAVKSHTARAMAALRAELAQGSREIGTSAGDRASLFRGPGCGDL